MGDIAEEAPEVEVEVEVGTIIARLRHERGLSLEELARRSTVSASFLSAVERGKSDIALRRLARVARVFDLDVGALLSYYTPRARPKLLGSDERSRVDRGEGIDYRRLRLPDVNFELITVTLGPHTAFKDTISHPGIDCLHVTAGELVLVYEGQDHVMKAGDSGVWPGGHPHTFRNDRAKAAQFVAIVTETVWDSLTAIPRA